MIKNLLFDLGGVIMNIRRENAVQALEEIGMKDADSFLGEYVQKGPFLELEEGLISPSEFRNEIRKHIDGEVSDSAIDDAFSKFLTGIPEKRLNDLISLRNRGYKIYLLSNTNAIMWDGEIAAQFRKQGKNVDFYFDGIVTSFESKCCKPDERIFKIVLDKFGIRAEETLFFDDSEKNLSAAARLGFKTALVNPGTEFIDLL